MIREKTQILERKSWEEILVGESYKYSDLRAAKGWQAMAEEIGV